ncbi:MAG: hypothetical protein ACHQ49_02200 [Elusimicrobiota bacterium]
MKTPDAVSWNKVGETALLALVFLAPLAAHGRTYDPNALRTALVESCALALAAAWLLKGLARGRWEVAVAFRPALTPVLILAAWTLARFASSPFKSAAAPELVLNLSAWTLYAVALLEFGGARSAARLSFWTAAAASLIGALAAAQRFTLGPGQLAAFAAAALPIVLASRLDPEASPARRLLSGTTAAALAVLAAWSGSARGLAAFELSAVIFAVTAVSILRGPAARRTAVIALACAAAAALVAAPVPESGTPGLFAQTGRVGGALLAWALLAAAACGLRSALTLRRAGALAESGYAAAFASAFTAWALAAALGLAPSSGPGAWLAWAAGGLAAGMSPLARPRGAVLALPLPFGADVRRLLQGPVLVLFVALAVWPAGWLASDVRYNRALAEARGGRLDAALADAGRVWTGSAVYAPSLYLRGRVLMDQGKPGEALEAYALLDGVSPDFSRVHARRAEAYAAAADWPASARERERQAALTPLDVSNLTAWAEAARSAGDTVSARRAAARAQAVSPDDESVRLQLAANALLEKRLAARETAVSARRRRGTASRRSTPRRP